MSDYKLQTKSVKIPFYKQRPRTSILLDILSVLFLCGGGIGMLTGIAMAAYDGGGAIAVVSIVIGGLSALILHICADVICDIAVSKNCLIHIYGKAGLNFRTAKNLSHLSSVR